MWSSNTFYQWVLSDYTIFGASIVALSLTCSDVNPLIKFWRNKKLKQFENNNNDNKSNGEKDDDDDEKYETQPVLMAINCVLLVLNSSFFGKIAKITNNGIDLFICRILEPDEKEIIWQSVQLHFLILILSDYLVMTINVVRNKIPIIPHTLLNQIIWSILLFSSIKEATSTVQLLPITFILIHRTFYFGFLLMTTLSKFIKPTLLGLIHYQLIVLLVYQLCLFAIFLHQTLYFFTSPNGCVNEWTQLLIASYSATVMFVGPILFIKTLTVKK